MTKTTAQILAEIASTLPDNTTGQITPALLRQNLDDIANGYVNIADGSGVVPGTYGDSSHVAQLTVNSTGVVTSAANVAVSGGGGGLTVGSSTITGGVSGQLLYNNAGLLGTTPGGGGGGGGIGVPVFGSRADALPAVIPGTAGAIQLLGYSAPGDNGGGSYVQIGSPVFNFVGTGAPAITPPNLTSGGYPINVFSGTQFSLSEGSIFGPSRQPILAHCLTVMAIFDVQLGSGPPPTAPPSTLSLGGNTWTLAKFATHTVDLGGGQYYPAAIYYCADPVFTPVGTFFIISPTYPFNTAAVLSIFCYPGFTGAILDVTQSVVNNALTASTSLATGTLTAANELVFGICHIGQSPIFAAGDPTYTLPPGWFDIEPPINGRNVVAYTVTTSTAGATLNPTFTSGTYTTNAILATFKTYLIAANAPLFWEFAPQQYPLHTAQYGIDPASPDNALPFRAFTRWMASVSPPSDTTNGRSLLDAGSIVIVIGNPTVVYVSKPFGFQFNLRNGQQVSFSTTGQLPHGGTEDIIPGKLYYVQYGTVGAPMPFSIASISGTTMTTTGSPALVPGVMISGPGIVNNTFIVSGSANSWVVTPSNSVGATSATMGSGSFQISDTTIFAASGSVFGGNGQTPTAKGTAISTAGGSQSGTHYLTSYGDSWTDFVLDPGIYYSTGNITPGPASGLKKWRLLGSGARFETSAFFSCTPWIDINAPINGGITNFIFQTQFQTTNFTSGQGQVTLVRPAEASNFFVNSWVLLMCNELQGQNVAANWNCYTFEYQKVKSVNTSTGVIAFYDTRKYNYRSTLPTFVPSGGPAYTGQIVGPATIAQLSDCFDQEIEIREIVFYGIQGVQEEFDGVVSLKMIDCEIYSNGFKAGPFCSTMRNFTMERVICHNYQPEFDKMTDTIKIIDCDWVDGSFPFFQSASINKTIIERSRLEGGIDGTPKDMTIRDSVVGGRFRINTVYGPTERLTFINVTVGEVVDQLAQGSPLFVVNTGLSFANGTLKVSTGHLGWNGPSTFSSCPFVWGVQGGKIVFSTNIHTNGAPDGIALTCSTQDTMAMLSPFTCLDVYVDGSNNYCIDTDLPSLPTTAITITGSISSGTNQLVVTALSPADAVLMAGMTIVQSTGSGSLPANTTIANDIGVPNIFGGVGTYTLSQNHTGTAAPGSTFTASITDLFFLPHPCPRLTVINCTGGDFITDYSGAPAEIPMYSYFKRAFLGFGFQAANNAANYVKLAGNLKTWVIDVQKPYSGAATTYPLVLYIFGYKTVSGNTYPTFAVQTIDLKTAGIRTITASGVSGNTTNDALVAIPFFISGGHPVLPGQLRPLFSVVGAAGTVTCTTPFPHGLTGAISLILNGTFVVDGTFSCTVTGASTFTFANAAVGTSSGLGTYGSTTAGETLDKFPRFVMAAQTDHGVDWGSMSLNTTTAGIDLIADTITAAGEISH